MIKGDESLVGEPVLELLHESWGSLLIKDDKGDFYLLRADTFLSDVVEENLSEEELGHQINDFISGRFHQYPEYRVQVTADEAGKLKKEMSANDIMVPTPLWNSKLAIIQKQIYAKKANDEADNRRANLTKDFIGTLDSRQPEA